MERAQLSPDKVSPAAKAVIADMHRTVVDEVAAAVARDKVVLVGMSQNPFVKKARKALEAANVKFTYLEYGSYLGSWKPRLAIKLWAGFPTFPMIFSEGTLIGGFAQLQAALADGTIK